MADTCMGIGVACVGREVRLPSDGHGFDDAACLALDAMIIVDVVELFLQELGGGEDGTTGLTGAHLPLVVWRVGSGADALMEKVCVVSLEGVVLAGVGGLEMTNVGEDGVANGKPFYDAACVLPYI